MINLFTCFGFFQELRELLSDRTIIRVKRIGELEEKPFMTACKQRFTVEEAQVQYAMLCSKWQENLKDPAWHPFKHVGTGDKKKVCLCLMLQWRFFHTGPLCHFISIYSGELVVMVLFIWKWCRKWWMKKMSKLRI